MALDRSHLRTAMVLGLLASATILLRIGNLWTEQIDWDEWSFILMGADVAHGHLPFVHQFDLKPPLIFFLFGATIALFGKSLVAIRLLGASCVFVAASFVFLTGRRLTSFWPAAAGATVCAVLACAPFGQATSSELPAIAFLAAAVWRLARSPLSVADSALAGVLVALAVLTRTNLALVAVVWGALLLAAALSPQSGVARWAWLAFGAAGLVPPVLLVAAYAAAGQLATLKLAMIDVPLAYSGQLGIAQVAREHAMQLYYTAEATPLLYGPGVLLALIGAGIAAVRVARSHNRAEAWPLIVLMVTTACVVASLLIGGAAYPHYWLQLMPFVGLFASLGAAALWHAGKALRATVLVLTLVPLAAGLAASLPQARQSYASTRPVEQAAAYIRRTGDARPTVWALHKHLVDWYLDAPQLSRAGVHPDNLARHAIIDTLAAHGYVGHDEVGRLMHTIPQFVVTDAGGKGLAWVRDDGKPIDAWLAGHYQRAVRFGDVLVYRRKGQAT